MVAARSKDKPVNTAGWLLRTQAADLLDVSVTTIKNWDGIHLHPQKVKRPIPNGGYREVWVYDPHECAKIPAARRQRARMMPGDPGEVAARAFEYFDEGKSLREVVILLREPPDRVDELHDQWQRLGGDQLVIGPAVHGELVKLVGPFEGVTALVERLRELLGERSASGVDGSTGETAVEVSPANSTLPDEAST